MMNAKQRYKMGYLGWLKETVSDFVDKTMLLDMVYGLLCLLLLISFPVSMPMVAAIRMIVTKRNMRKQYVRDELMGD
nr:MAG TPA: hypothetical protein [Caudoviricetes sp.]